MDLPVDTPHIIQNVQIPIRQADSDILPSLPSSGIEYDQRAVVQDKLSTYTSLNDYHAMFKARHGRGAIDNMTITGEKVSITSQVMVPTSATSRGVTENPMTGKVSKHTPSGEYSLPSQQGQASVEEEYQSPAEYDVVPPVGVGHILEEGAAIFTDMTETMLAALDKQMALPDAVQKSASSSMNNFLASGPISSQSEIRQDMPVMNASQPNTSPISTQGPKTIPISSTKGEDKYPDLYLPVTGNYRISDKFYGYMDSVSVDNNPMILVELTGLSYRYGPTIYTVDRVNGTMHDRFSRGFRMISERATIEPQYRGAPLAGMYRTVQPMYMSTLLGMSQMVTPLARPTTVTQNSQIPIMIPNRMPPVRDILEPASNEQARADYLERQMRPYG